MRRSSVARRLMTGIPPTEIDHHDALADRIHRIFQHLPRNQQSPCIVEQEAQGDQDQQGQAGGENLALPHIDPIGREDFAEIQTDRDNRPVIAETPKRNDLLRPVNRIAPGQRAPIGPGRRDHQWRCRDIQADTVANGVGPNGQCPDHAIAADEHRHTPMSSRSCRRVSQVGSTDATMTPMNQPSVAASLRVNSSDQRPDVRPRIGRLMNS